MISYHPDSDRASISQHYSTGFKTVDTNDVTRIAQGIVKFAWSNIVWKDGKRGKQNFLFSDFCALDIDDTLHTYPLDQALREYADKIHIIGTTRNHQQPKDGITCDRYRIVVPWETRITSRSHYEGNMHALRAINDAIDKSTLDASRHFFRCREIVSVSTEGYKQDVLDEHFNRDEVTDGEYLAAVQCKMLNYKMLSRLPRWLTRFLETGEGEAGTRHFKTLGAAMELAEYGLPFQEILKKLSAIPISRPYRPGEVADIAKYAVKYVAGRMRSGKQEAAEAEKSHSVPGPVKPNQRPGSI